MKIPCIICTIKLWKRISSYLKQWGYKIETISDFNTCPLLVINRYGTFGICTNLVMSDISYHNRELIKDTEEFLQKAAILKGFIYENNMEKIDKEIKINVPEGMEAYLENNIIKFRPIKKELTYDNIVEELFYDKTHYIINSFGKIADACSNRISYIHTLNTKTEKQAKKLLAINKLMNVAKYLNKDWQPDWNNGNESKYYIRIRNNIIETTDANFNCSDIVYFKTYAFAQQAIDILGEETIKLALCTDW